MESGIIEIPVKGWNYSSSEVLDLPRGVFAQQRTAAENLARRAENCTIVDADGDEVLFRYFYIPDDISKNFKDISGRKALIYKLKRGKQLTGLLLGVIDRDGSVKLSSNNNQHILGFFKNNGIAGFRIWLSNYVMIAGMVVVILGAPAFWAKTDNLPAFIAFEIALIGLMISFQNQNGFLYPFKKYQKKYKHYLSNSGYEVTTTIAAVDKY